MSSEPSRPAGGPRPQPRDRHPVKTAGKALVAIPKTVAMPFLITFRALRGIWRDPASHNILFAAGMLLLAGTLIFMILERWSLVDAFYFSFITLATIGYGDISPTTDLSKIVTVIYGIAGLGVMAALISSIASQGWRSRERHPDSEDEADDEAGND